MGRMVFTVMAAVAELERSIITERGQAGRRACKAAGKAFWTAHCDGRPSSSGGHEGSRHEYQSHREGVRHCPLHGSQHPGKGGEMWFRNPRKSRLIVMPQESAIFAMADSSDFRHALPAFGKVLRLVADF